MYAGAGLALAISFLIAVSVKNSIVPKGIVLHHSATPSPDTPLSVLTEVHKKRGFSNFYWGRNYAIGYHYLIYPDGLVVATRPEHLIGAHVTGYNSYIGICIMGNFSRTHNRDGSKGPQSPTAEQLRSLVKLCKSLRARYGFPLDRIKGHRELDPTTECPGDGFPLQSLVAELK